MAVYKVPQDVEADDKLIGPFSFRQFFYLAGTILGLVLAWGLGSLFLPLAIIPLPIVLFLGALALPLRKDQPMEIYLAAMVSFYLKPRRRLWQPDGQSSLIEVRAPVTTEVQRTKDISRDEAQRRLSYLADIVDTGGWALRGLDINPSGTAINSDVYYEAQQTQDMMDEAATITQNFEAMIEKNDQKRRQEIMDRMKNPSSFQAPPTSPAVQPAPQGIEEPANLTFDPYPTSIRQSVIQPLSEQQPQTANTPTGAATNVQQAPTHQSTSEITLSPDIIDLANRPSLSIQTIAHEASRIREREQGSEEVVIPLR